MSLVVYAPCRIQFRSNDKPSYERDYSDRTLLELRQYDFNDYSLRALDMENSKAEIFNIPLKNRDLYKFGSSFNNPDEIRPNNGTYRLWLNVTSRDQFHQSLRAVLETLDTTDTGSPQPKKSPDVSSKYPQEPSSGRPSKPTASVDQMDTLVDIHNLSEYIRKGKADAAAELAQKLISKRVQLQTITSKGLPKEVKFEIEVQIDGIAAEFQDNKKTTYVNVYELTTIHELRAIFQATHQYPPGNQYFFVNGHLAHEKSSMNDLKVQKHSLFVLFVIPASTRF